MSQRLKERLLWFEDAIARRGVSAGDIGDEEWWVFQGAHPKVGRLFLISDTDKEIAGFGGLEGCRINQDEAIFLANGFDDADEAGNLSLGRLGFSRKNRGDLGNTGKEARDEGSLRLISL